MQKNEKRYINQLEHVCLNRGPKAPSAIVRVAAVKPMSEIVLVADPHRVEAVVLVSSIGAVIVTAQDVGADDEEFLLRFFCGAISMSNCICYLGALQTCSRGNTADSGSCSAATTTISV
tara:strand:+ start:597 stop:953 length:357 start_codon:yes stop_codon:yes gene_type:complete